MALSNATAIKNNIIAACNNIASLNATGYKYLRDQAGFCAEYNLEGFKDRYETGRGLAGHIVACADHNRVTMNTATKEKNELFQSIVETLKSAPFYTSPRFV